MRVCPCLVLLPDPPSRAQRLLACSFSRPRPCNQSTLPTHTTQQTQFREYEHLAQAIGLRYRPLRGQLRPNAFGDVVWLDPAAVVDAVRRAWAEAGGGGGGEREEL